MREGEGESGQRSSDQFFKVDSPDFPTSFKCLIHLL